MFSPIVPFSMPPKTIIAVDAVRRCLVDEVRLLLPSGGGIMVVSDKVLQTVGIVEPIVAMLRDAGFSVSVYLDVEPEPSLDALAQAVAYSKENTADLIIGLGGGSPMDISKGMAVFPFNDGPMIEYMGKRRLERPGIPTIQIPTTSGTGSEVTKNAAFKDTAKKVKYALIDPMIMPALALIDPVLTLTAPPGPTAASGVDAFTHAMEAYVAQKATPHSDLYAVEAMRRIAGSLRRAVARGDDIHARYDMCLGSAFGGIANGTASVGAVHALSYPLGAEYDLPHGVSNALMLPHVVEKTIVGNTRKFSRIASFMGENIDGLSECDAADKAVAAINRLCRDVGIPPRLRDFAIPQDILPVWAKRAVETQQRLLSNTPKNLSEQDILDIYTAAW